VLTTRSSSKPGGLTHTSGSGRRTSSQNRRWLPGAEGISKRTSLGHGMKARRVEVQGPRHLVRTLGRWGEQGVLAAQNWGPRAA
jgi:hypothetical protein